MNWPERIRQTLETLFTSRLVVELRRELEEARRERDYFRGKCDKLELIALKPVAQPIIGPRRPLPAGRIGRKPWREVMAEHLAREESKAQEAAKAKSN